MRMIHIADVHLGKICDGDKSWSHSRGQEIWSSLENVIDACNQKKADVLLITGDLFNRQPIIKELKEVDYLFGKLRRTQVILMAGAADYVREQSPLYHFNWSSHVTLLPVEENSKISFPFLDADFYGFSYDTDLITDARYDKMKVMTVGNSDLKATEEEMQYKILLGYGGGENQMPIDLATLSRAGFHYVGLGGIHTPKIYEQYKMAYAGSLEPLSHTEMGPHGYMVVEISGDHTHIEFVPIAKREYKEIQLIVNDHTSQKELEHQLAEYIDCQGKNNIYTVKVRAQKNNASDDDTSFGSAKCFMQLHTDALYKLGNIYEVTRKSESSLPIDEIMKEHKNDIIGKYIEKLSMMPQTEVTKKALTYGIEALMPGERQA